MVAATLSTVGKGGIFIAFILGFGLSLGMNKLLSQVRNLGLVTHLMMMRLIYPATITLLFGKVLEFVTFDIIPTELFYPYIFDLPEGAFSEEADSIGYSSHYIIPNAGSITIFLLASLILQIIFAILAKIICEGKVLRFVKWKQDSFMWSGLVDFFTDIYLTLSYCVCINFSSMDFDSRSEIINNSFNIFVGLALILGPILVVRGLDKGWQVYQSPPATLEGNDDEEKSQKDNKVCPMEEEKVEDKKGKEDLLPEKL